ncbi:hypothetical protein ANCCAN_08499, partial [Ancylostoma caninum]
LPLSLKSWSNIGVIHLLRIFQILEALGKGSFGAVFRVRRLPDRKELAMKCESQRMKRKILKHEAKVFDSLRQVDSPHFIALLDRGKVTGRFSFIIMRLVSFPLVINKKSSMKDLRYQRVKAAFRGTTRYASVGALGLVLEGGPVEYMSNIILYIDTLEYSSIPDYDHIAAQLQASMEAYHLSYADPPDWDLMVAYLGPRYEMNMSHRATP